MQDFQLNKSIKNIIQHRYLTFVFRLILGSVFIYASIDKIMSPAEFANDIRNYNIIFPAASNLAAIILPWLEFYCGLFLINGLFTRTSAGIISLLLFFFMFILISAIYRGLDIDCGCFGTGANVGWGRVLEDITLLAMSLQIFFYDKMFLSVENLFNKQAEQ